MPAALPYVILRSRETLLARLARQQRRFLELAHDLSHAYMRVSRAREGESWGAFRRRLAAIRRAETALDVLTDEERIATAGAEQEAALRDLEAAGAPLDEHSVSGAPRAHDALLGLMQRLGRVSEDAWRAELYAAPALARWCIEERRQATSAPRTTTETVTDDQLRELRAWATVRVEHRVARDAQAALDGSGTARRRAVKTLRLIEAGILR